MGTSEAQDWYPLLLRFFNRRFEFYGRKLEMVKIGCGGLSATQEQQHACAQDADEEKKVFAVTHGGAQRPPFIAAVAKRGLVHVSSQPYMTEQTMSELHPGSWQYPMALNKIMSNMGSWVCSRLHGFDAVHAGDPLLQRSKRVFGIVYHELDDPNADTEPIEREMERCGATPKKVVKDPYSFTTKYQTKASTIMVDMKNEGVTSIICLCQATAFGDLTRAATLQRYRPEWLISSYAFLDIDWQIRQWSDPNQLAQAFGLTFNPRHWRLTDQPAVWAVKEVDPEYSTANRSEDSYWMHGLMRDYRSLLLLASGIQMAGPHLTNETFARALQRTTFPNPDHYLMAGKVGFEQRSHSMTTDAAEWWWGAAARSPYGTEGAQSGQGALCYVDGGARHSQGNWPRGGDPFFDNPAACDSGG